MTDPVATVLGVLTLGVLTLGVLTGAFAIWLTVQIVSQRSSASLDS